jgi:uncharacterized protein (DUF58 family)
VDPYQRRVSSLFSTSIVLWLIGLCLIAALLNGARPLIILCLLVFCLMAGLRIWTKSSDSRLSWTFSIDKEKSFPGEPIGVALTAENRKLLPVSFETRIPFQDTLDSPSGDQSLQGGNGLLWYQSINIEWQLIPRKRGVHTIGPAIISTGDLFGFLWKEKELKEQVKVVVYPRLIPLGPLPLPRRDFFGIPGGESPVDDPVYVLGTIDYHYGRPARHIHWKATARHARLQQKVFEPTEQEKVLFVADVSGFKEERDEMAFEETLEVIASLAVRLEKRGCAIGLTTNAAVTDGSAVIPVARNRQQIALILETLARMRMQSTMEIFEIVQKGIIVPWGCTCLYFALSSTSETDRGKTHFSRGKTPLLFLSYPNICDLRSVATGAKENRGSSDITAAGSVTL